MADNRAIAAKAMDLAKEAVMKERQDEHGDAENSFQMIADLWNVYLRHQFIRAGVPNPGYSITALDVAEMMAQLKLARRKYGNVTQIDHYADDIGYVALAAMLATPKIDMDPLGNHNRPLVNPLGNPLGNNNRPLTKHPSTKRKAANCRYHNTNLAVDCETCEGTNLVCDYRGRH